MLLQHPVVQPFLKARLAAIRYTIRARPRPDLSPLLQVDGGEVVIVSAENFWNELTKVMHPSERASCIMSLLLRLPDIDVMALLMLALVMSPCSCWNPLFQCQSEDAGS